MTEPLLPDVLPKGLAAVIAGTAAGTESARRGAYYADPRNQFWPVLARTGLTPRLFQPEEFSLLPDHGIGLTDLERQRAGMDREALLERPDTHGFLARILVGSPRILAFNGKTAAELVLSRTVGQHGQQPDRLRDMRVWVLPSTSGAARGTWDEVVWVDFAAAVRRIIRVARANPQ